MESRPFSVTGGRIVGATWAAMSFVGLWATVAGAWPAPWVEAVQSFVLGRSWPMLSWISFIVIVLPLACIPGLLYDWGTHQGMFDLQRTSTRGE